SRTGRNRPRLAVAPVPELKLTARLKKMYLTADNRRRTPASLLCAGMQPWGRLHNKIMNKDELI
ncbi:MAG: hypothetical protein Q7U68_07175, partial [Candidatus Roizmanbacteria bacterium]|nr:hypothetical protein [Candidatus Roizmanbacteria bacterium]